MTVIPAIGEIRKSAEIGKSPHYGPYIGVQCPECGEIRWKRLYNYNRTSNRTCFICTNKRRAESDIPEEKDELDTPRATHDSCRHWFYKDYDYNSYKYVRTCLWCGYEEALNA